MNILAMFTSTVFALFAAAALSAEERPETVRAADFGWDLEDATECLQRAIDSGAKTVIVDPQQGDWIVRPIKLTNSNVEVVLKGVSIRAKRGEFRDKHDSLIQISGGATNVTLRGEGRSVLR